jgi:hypothetical protein
MRKAAIFLLIAAVLLIIPGCATIAIGIGAGLAGGVAHFGGKKLAEKEYDWYERNRRCKHLRTAITRQRCMNRLRYLQTRVS